MKSYPGQELIQPALDDLSYTALLTYPHLAPFLVTLSQQIKVPILQALYACG